MQRQKLTIHDRQYRGSGLQRQNLTINFDQKSRTQATFTYKQGEIDKNGIEVELTNVDVVNATGQVRVKDPEGNFLEPGMVTVIGSKANFILPTYTPGTWEFELRIFNDNGTAISSTYAYTVMESFNTDDTTVEVYESLWDTWTKEFVSWSDAERTREANESGRIIEHSERIETVDKAINDAKSATVSATVATQATLDAIDNATHATQATLDAIDDAVQATQATLDAIDDAAQATSNAQKATSDANSATTKATEATVKANTATTTANQATANANKATADANSATQSVNNAIDAGTVDLETKQARTDATGFVHANLKTRLDEDFKELASKIPTDVAMNGYESVTTNDTLAGDVSGAVVTGRTWVNEYTNSAYDWSTNATFNNNVITYSSDKGDSAMYWRTKTLKEDTSYTFYFNLSQNGSRGILDLYTWGAPFVSGFSLGSTENGTFKLLVKTKKKSDSVSGGWVNDRISLNVNTLNGSVILSNLIILEGDHTDKPLEFFEGLKSAEVAEIGTHGVNLVDGYALAEAVKPLTTVSGFTVKDGRNCLYWKHASQLLSKDLISLANGSEFTYKPNTRYKISYEGYRADTTGFGAQIIVNYTDGTYSYCTIAGNLVWSDTLNWYTANGKNVSSIGMYYGTGGAETWWNLDKFTIVEVTGSEPSTYVPYTSSKATLPSPIILRSLPNGVADTYDFDTQTLTRRCGEVVLNGSESTITMHASNETLIRFYITLDIFKNIPVGSGGYLCSDRYVYGNTNLTVEAMSLGGSPLSNGNLFIVITKSKLPTPDVAGFKAWLAQNPTTVVYQLAEPTTEYIENNGQLRSYDYQTTVSAESVVPVKLSGSVPVNYASTLATLSTVARELKLENLSLIEQAETLEQQLLVANETNDYQDSLIDVSLLATDELYTLIEPLLPELFSNTKGGNAMVDAYVAMVIKGLKTIDQVPSRYREDVKRVLAELEK